MIRALFAFFKYSDNVYIGLYTFILCGLASWFAFELRFSKKRKWFILLSVLAVVNSVELTCVGDPVRAIMQVFMLVVLLLVFRLKKNGKSGYQTMKM